MFLPSCRTLYFSVLSFMRFLSAQFSSRGMMEMEPGASRMHSKCSPDELQALHAGGGGVPVVWESLLAHFLPPCWLLPKLPLPYPRAVSSPAQSLGLGARMGSAHLQARCCPQQLFHPDVATYSPGTRPQASPRPRSGQHQAVLRGSPWPWGWAQAGCGPQHVVPSTVSLPLRGCAPAPGSVWEGVGVPNAGICRIGEVEAGTCGGRLVPLDK